MAKSSRASTRKTNNQRLKAKVFGPVEAARAERLSAKLLELAAQPKPQPEEAEMKIVDGAEGEAAKEEDAATAAEADNTMDVDSAKPTSKRSDKKRIEKRRKTSKIVFPKYGDKKKTKRR
ncbi:hypothetical protein F4815DRAFT_10261 [Daldinia loculata]|uniref:uncharacterized protein n=1 Tax=Daldinia loculata TaxID=103429 RepID=UPI0020C4F53F|nr:uncharacterized protein F4817DRAFT_145142 [Daldinia loculata]KAI1646338.1 hypothetical protein F4817DRAFT_145142 [Daldinia loculata]KAI2785180.1 hypothetical protein F4815DRAFT_10261 [Daldinia loculata]